MELLITLRNTNNIDKLNTICDGVIVGSCFSSGYSYSIEDLKKLRVYCSEHNLKFYIVMDNFVSENDKELLFNYMDFLDKLNVDGIYYHDLGVYEVAKSYGLVNKLIYDGQTVMCNSLDVAYYMSKGLQGVEISRELTFDEVKAIVLNNRNKCDIQIFGHLRMSYSKRKFLSNYFNEIDRSYDYLNKKSLYLIEEMRDYKMPIIEDNDGTRIYTDYVFEMYEEIAEIKPYINRGIVDTLFIPDEMTLYALRDFKRVTKENCSFLKHNLHNRYPDTFSSGYLYEKTNITKDE